METKTEIDYRFCGCTDSVAYVLISDNDYKREVCYKIPYIFDSIEDAYHAACIHLSGK